MNYPTRDEIVSPGIDRKRRPAVDRLLTRFVVEPNGCWRWTRALTGSGYGHFSIRSVYYQAHLLMYILLVGPLPVDLEPDHLCRNRACVNPNHLEFVTHAVNSRRGSGTRLTETQVSAIRAARAAGEGVRALAREYGVNHAQVSRIVNGRAWREGLADVGAAAA
jgi:hypothetical protein